ncbi:hypothetical protein [Petrachloros mirabilis]
MKLELYVHAQPDPYVPGGVQYQAATHDMSEFWGPVIFHGYVDVPVDPVTPADLIPGQVAILRKEQQAIRADAEVKANRIEEQISKLQAMEFTP